MRDHTLRCVLMIKAIEDSDRAGALIPPADRAAATREAARAERESGNATADAMSAGPLTARAQRLLAKRAEILRRGLVIRFPFVNTMLTLAGGPPWVAWLFIALSLLLGFSLSALDGTRHINVLAFPLLGLVLWNLLIYAALCAGWLRALRRHAPSQSLLAQLLTETALGRIKRLAAKSMAFNAPLAEALARFVQEWYEAARPLLVARATRLLHLCAAAVGLGLIAGLYLRGIALDYEAGWESTLLNPEQVHGVLAIAYGPASSLTGIPIPDTARLAAIRWEGGHGGENAAPWIHLLAATSLLFVVLPRLGLAFFATLVIWHRSHAAPMPPSIIPYFRTAFGTIEGVVGRGIIAVMPYAYEPPAAASAALRKLLPAALGDTLAVDLRAPVLYGDEDAFMRNLADRGGSIADAITLLFSLAATPEEENHGSVIAGVRDWLAHSRRHAQLLVLVDERPYAARMSAQAGFAERLAERRRLWQAFVAARGPSVCFIDLGEGRAEADPSEVERVRAALWQPAHS